MIAVHVFTEMPHVFTYKKKIKNISAISWQSSLLLEETAVPFYIETLFKV
jgi:hypothetical protein